MRVTSVGGGGSMSRLSLSHNVVAALHVNKGMNASWADRTPKDTLPKYQALGRCHSRVVPGVQ